MNTKQIVAIACVAIVLVAGIGILATNDSDETTKSSPWSPSGIVGSIPDVSPTLEDDFFMNINYDRMKESVVIGNESLIGTTNTTVMMQMVGMISGETASYEQELLQDINAAYRDRELRTAMGTDELMPLIDDLMAAEDLDDLTAYLTSGKYMISNPFLSTAMDFDYKDSTVWATYVSPAGLTLSDPATYSEPNFETQMDKKTDAYNELLVLIGYSVDEAEYMNEQATELEIEIAQYCMTAAERMHLIEMVKATYNPYTIDELREASPTFPIADILVSQGFEDDKYILEEPEWLDAMNRLYTEENFEGLRTLLLRNHVMMASQFMGTEFFDTYLESMGMTADMAMSLLFTGNGLPVYNWLLNDVYLSFYSPDEETVDAIESMFDALRDAFAVCLMDATWMSDETRADALEKLDAMGIYVGGPESPDFSAFILPSATSSGGPLSDYIAMDEFNKDVERSKINTSDYRTHMFSARSYTVNAVNIYNCNSILVTAAFMQVPYCEGLGLDTSMEEQLAGLGFVLAHEITHGFDPVGINFDKDSNFNDWWTESERDILESMMDEYADYFSTFETVPAGTHVNGDMVLSEAVADLGSMAILLNVAKTVNGFDYEQFFTMWCENWYQTMSPDYAEEVVKVDIHPYNCYRINATIQQFQEFYDTFGIEKGDGMYLSPEDRYAVW